MRTSVRNLLASSIGGILLAATPVFAQVTADDFLAPPITGNDAKVQKPDEVKIEGDTVTAATARDAGTTAANKEQKDLAGGGSGIGAEMLKFPSGMGVMASGLGTYSIMDNPVATRISQREAYITAFTQAKKNMAEFLKGLSHDEKQTIRQSMANVETDKRSLTNTQDDSNESINQAVNMILRGFVVFEVRDDLPNRTVYVSIVTTPKTCGAVSHSAANAIVVDDLHEGIAQVLDEVRSGLVPPVGGRIITIRSTGETAFVGFGSEVARSNKSATVQAKLNLEVQKIARMRAQGSLCGLISGDELAWKGDFSSEHHESSKEFEAAAAGDPIAPDGTGVKKLDAQRLAFLSKMQGSEVYDSARKGFLPPGVNIKTWFNDDNTWVFAMAVYLPSTSNLAAKAADDMNNARIVQPLSTGESADGAAGSSASGFKDQNGGVARPGSEIKPGPTTKSNTDDF